MEDMIQAEEELMLINDYQRCPLELRQPEYPCDPYPWLIYCDGERGERQTFYSILEDVSHTCFLPELDDQDIHSSNQEWLVLIDYSAIATTCSVLNILTMEKLQLPPCNEVLDSSAFVLTLSKMDDGSWSVFIFTGYEHKLISCHLGVDNEFVEQEWLTDEYPIDDCVSIECGISFGGNLYIMTSKDYDLLCADLSADPGHLDFQQVINGYPITQMVEKNVLDKCYLVESCGELLFVIIEMLIREVIGITVFKADFKTSEWVRLDGLGDRVIFLDDECSGFSYPASTFGLNANCIYYARNHGENLWVYDVQDQSVSTPFPYLTVNDIVPSVAWMFISNKNSGPLNRSVMSSEDLHLHHGKADNDADEARRGCIEYESQEVVESNNTPWGDDIPNDILCEIYSRLVAGERTMFLSTCRSWSSSVNCGFVTAQQQQSFQLIPPDNNSDQCSCSSPRPCMMLFGKNRIFHPIYDRSCDNINDFNYIPSFRLVMAKGGWFLGKQYGKTIFWNPLTKEKVILPDFPLEHQVSMYFSSAPTSADWFVIATVWSWVHPGGRVLGMYTLKCGDASWSRCFWLEEKQIKFDFSRCNPAVYNGVYYFLGSKGKLMIYDSKSKKFFIHEAPESVSHYYVLSSSPEPEHYILEADGRILAVFAKGDGSSITTMEWNISEEIWETVESLGNKMLFVSNKCSCCVSATTTGTGNKIYFPRFVGSHGLFYSLSTKKLHTFEILGASTYKSFTGSKFPLRATWWMP